jgi:hypothetical protein
MRRQYYISIQKCPLGFWHSQAGATSLQPVSNDRFNDRMEKMYPAKRPWYFHK